MNPELEGTPRYFAWLYGSERMRAVLAPLFGIEAQINAALRPGLEHAVAHVRMRWWAEETQRLHGGTAVHPLTRALLAQRPTSLAADAAGPDIRGLVDVATWDLACATFETGRELAGYCDRWARAVTEPAALWSAPDLPAQPIRQFGHGLGVALCELELLVGLQQSAGAGRLRLPLDELGTLGVPPETLARTPWPPALVARLSERHRQLRAAVVQNCALLQQPAQRTALRGLLVWAALMLQHSRRAERALPRSWQRSRRDGVADALRAWRTARRATRRGPDDTFLDFLEHS
ncbi:MAG TPA: squalene/phytoene synthase family protein [Steroidobacteraceae bacterium]|nr:squalene/phytoene synthase family protein [Steroidobacteraceae bacterium]